MIRSSLVSLALAGFSFFPTQSLLAQVSKALPSATGNTDAAKQDPQGSDKRALEAELRALKEQSAELEALVKKLKQQTEQGKAAVVQDDAGRKKGVAQEREAVRQQQAAAQAEQEARAEKEAAERKKAAAERIARIEKRVAAEIARVKENAKKEIEKAKAEARAPQEEQSFVLMENGDIAMFEQGQPTPPPARKRAAIAPMLAERIDGPSEGKRPQRSDSEDGPFVVMLDDVSEAHRTKKETPDQEPAARSPMFGSTKKVEGKPVERVIVEGKPAPQVWRKTEIETQEDDMHWFVSGDDGLPHHRVEMRERRIETNDDADGACCDCECPMCGEGKKPQPPRAGREVERVREIRSRTAQRGEQPRGRAMPRGEDARRIIEMRIEGDDEDMEIERLLGELRRRLQARRDENRGPRMFEVRRMQGDDAAPQFVIETEDMPAPKKPATEVRRTRAKKAPADAGDEAPTEVRGVRIVPPQDGEPAPVEMRRTRTKKPSNVAPVPMPPASDDDGDAPHEIPPSSGGR